MNDKFDPHHVDLGPYEKDYSEQGFWEKVSNYFHKIGKDALLLALTLYYAAKDPITPDWVRVFLYSALGYFISPIDVVPDFIPLVGYSDDLIILSGILLSLTAYVSKEHEEEAAEKVISVFNSR